MMWLSMRNKFKHIIYFSILFALPVFFESCSKNADPVFLVNLQRDFNVEPTLSPIVTHFFELKNIPTNFQSNLDAFGLPQESVSLVSPADATLTTASGFANWSLVNWVEIYAVSRINPNNRLRIYFINERDPGNDNEVRLFNTFADLSELMNEETIDLEVRIRTIAPMNGNFRARLLFNYAVFDEI